MVSNPDIPGNNPVLHHWATSTRYCKLLHESQMRDIESSGLWNSDVTFIKMFAGLDSPLFCWVKKDITEIKAVHRGQSSTILRAIKKAKWGWLCVSLKTYLRSTVCIPRVLNPKKRHSFLHLLAFEEQITLRMLHKIKLLKQSHDWDSTSETYLFKIMAPSFVSTSFPGPWDRRLPVLEMEKKWNNNLIFTRWNIKSEIDGTGTLQ